MTVQIDRTKWLRGNHTDCMFLNAAGERCIFGFILRELGIPDTDLLGKASFIQLAKTYTPRLALLLDTAGFPIPLVTHITEVNDASYVSDFDREDELTMLLMLFDIHLTFTNVLVPA